MLPSLIESFESALTHEGCQALLAGRIDAAADPKMIQKPFE
jgi:hypothetical protein